MNYRTRMETRRDTLLHFCVLVLVVATCVIGLYPELSISRVDLNDNVSHFALIERIVQTVEHGGNPLDTWSPEWDCGFPVLRVYQPLAHLFVAALYFAFAKTIPLMTLFVWVRFLAVVLTPLSFYAAARLLEFPLPAALAAACIAPLISSAGLFGLEFGSYVWAGNGLFPQSIAAHLLLLSLGFGYRALRNGKGITLTGVLLALTCLAHLIYGYIGALSLCLLALLPDGKVPRPLRIRRTLYAGVVAFALSCFQLLPLLTDSPILNHSRWEPAWKWDSFGAAATLAYLFKGQFLDANRLPVLSLLAAAGAILTAVRWRNATHAARFALAAFTLWTLLLFGRPFWGPVLYLFGISPDMQLHRVAAAVQIFAVLLAAVSFAEGYRWKRPLALLVALLVLVPATRERAAYLINTARWGRGNLAAYTAAEPALNATIDAVKQAGGRVYAGVPAGWGGQHKVGSVPFFAFLSTRQVPAVAYLYHALALTAEIQPHFNEWSPDHYRLFGIRTVVAPAGIRTALPPFWTRTQTIGRFDLFSVPTTGYFDVVDVPDAARITKETFYDVTYRWMQSGQLEQHRHLRLDLEPGIPEPGPVPPSAPGTVVRETNDGESFHAQVALDRPAWVLFKMTWHPNWRARVDEHAVSTAMLTPGFTGIQVPAGAHQVHLTYHGSTWKLWLALAGIAAAIALHRSRKQLHC